MFKAEDVKSSLLWLVHDREAEEDARKKSREIIRVQSWYPCPEATIRTKSNTLRLVLLGITMVMKHHDQS